MTNTNDLREMIALADRIADQKASWLPISGHVKNITLSLPECDAIDRFLRASASRADFDAGRVAGQRDMQERKCEFCFGTGRHQGRFEHNGALCANCGGAGTIASLPLNVESGEPVFVLLGRDPQAPELVEQWARDRLRYEPKSDKPSKAFKIAREMRGFKLRHPELGMAMPSDPTPDSASAVREALERLLACPAISDESHSDPEWGDPETAQAVKLARAALNVEGGAV